MLTKNQIEKILIEAKKQHDKDKKFQYAHDVYINHLAPGGIPVAIELSFVESFIRGLDMFEPRLRDEIEYLLYESGHIKGKCECKFEGKKYDAHNIKSYSEFIFAVLNENQDKK
jgi:hypothetical protein